MQNTGFLRFLGCQLLSSPASKIISFIAIIMKRLSVVAFWLAGTLVLVQGAKAQDFEALSRGSDFSCTGRAYGYYADPKTDCQVFHICLGRQDVKWSFMCPNGTIFNQQHFVCDFTLNVDCNLAEEFYNLNELFQYSISNVNSTNETETFSNTESVPIDRDIHTTNKTRRFNPRKSTPETQTNRPQVSSRRVIKTSENQRQTPSDADRVQNVEPSRESTTGTTLGPHRVNSELSSPMTALGTTQTP